MCVCVYVYMLCKYESRYGYMSVCIPVSVDFYNFLWVILYVVILQSFWLYFFDSLFPLYS